MFIYTPRRADNRSRLEQPVIAARLIVRVIGSEGHALLSAAKHQVRVSQMNLAGDAEGNSGPENDHRHEQQLLA
jgi:hypothetical protein